MTKHCSNIIPPTNFPSEFSENGKRHNISYQVPSTTTPKSPLATSDNNNIPRLSPNFEIGSLVGRK